MSKETSTYQTVRYKAQPITALPHWTHAELWRKESLCERAEGHTQITRLLTINTMMLCVKVQGSDPQIRRPQKTPILSRRWTKKPKQHFFSIWEQNDEFTVGEMTEVGTHRFTFPELLLSTVKVKVHVQALHKLCNRIFVGVRFLRT